MSFRGGAVSTATPDHEEIVYLGRDVAEDKGRYVVRVVTFPKGSVKEDGAVKISDARKKGMKTLASITLERTE